MIYRVNVIGRVQGVGFRYFTQRMAQEMGIKGWVKNLFDGSVEVVFETDDNEKKERFIEILRKGPSLARVDHLYIEEVSGIDIPQTFIVKY